MGEGWWVGGESLCGGRIGLGGLEVLVGRESTVPCLCRYPEPSRHSETLRRRELFIALESFDSISVCLPYFDL